MAGAAPEDDFATVPVPDAARGRWFTMYFAILGMATALFNMQIIAVVTLSHGPTVALWTILYAVVVGGAFSSVVVAISVRTGFGISLLARTVLGYRGASFFSLLAAYTGMTFFIAEAGIMASSLRGLAGGLPDTLLLPAVALVMVPLVYLGIRALVRFQLVTFVLYLALIAAALHVSIASMPGHQAPFLHRARVDAGAGIGLLTAMGLVNGAIFPIVLVTADYARFVRREDRRMAQLWLGPMFQLCAWGLQGLAGIWFALRYSDLDPGSFFVTMLGAWGVVLAVATQLRINLINMYSGSLAVVNLVQQGLDLVVSRHVVVVLFGVVASVGLVLGVTESVLPSLRLIGLSLLAFTILLVADVHLVRPVQRGASLPYKAYAIGSWRPVACVSLLCATAVGGVLAMGWAGTRAELGATFATAATQLALYVAGSWLERRIRSARPASGRT